MPTGNKVSAVAFIADQRFVSLFKFVSKGFHDCFSVFGIFAGLFGIVANNVAAFFYLYLFDLQWRRILAAISLRIHYPISSCP